MRTVRPRPPTAVRTITNEFAPAVVFPPHSRTRREPAPDDLTRADPADRGAAQPEEATKRPVRDADSAPVHRKSSRGRAPAGQPGQGGYLWATHGPRQSPVGNLSTVVSCDRPDDLPDTRGSIRPGAVLSAADLNAHDPIIVRQIENYFRDKDTADGEFDH